ncbi:TetR/AcrR family transcriptional regulator [Nocardia sp. NPDC056611]|uniref:TetR/AcrR family transcriptional regulator n=1 Tax=Nocardia sp. NPDC056611 TaxID=3345877 RepID=UPI0036703195
MPEQHQSRGDTRRVQIIGEALRTFATNGYRDAALSEIAERCGLTVPGLLHYFPNKEALLAAVLDQYDQIDLQRLTFLFDASGPQALRWLVQLAEYYQRRPWLSRLFAVLTGEAVTANHPAHAWIVSRYRHLTIRLGQTLEKGKIDGAVRADVDSAAVARQALAMMDCLQLQWLLDPESVDMPAAFGRYIDTLIVAIAK